jgi:hypothetical protein
MSDFYVGAHAAVALNGIIVLFIVTPGMVGNNAVTTRAEFVRRTLAGCVVARPGAESDGQRW